MSRGKHAALRELRRGRTLVVLTVLAMLVGLMAAVPATATVTLYTDATTFESETGATAIAWPGGADQAETGLMYARPFGTGFGSHSCNEASLTSPGGEVTVTKVGSGSPNYICFIGADWAASLSNTNPKPRVPTIVNNGEDDYDVAIDLAVPAAAIGFGLLTNSSASESITLTYENGTTETIDDGSLGTDPNSFEFVGIYSDLPITRVVIDTTGGASQNEGIEGIWLLPVGVLNGTVTDATSGSPLSLADITTSAPDPGTASTDSTGFYEFSNISPGTFEVSAWAPGFMGETMTGVTVLGGTTTTQNFALMPAATTAADCAIDEYFVSASGTGPATPVVTTDPLVAGHEYDITAKGVFYAGGINLFDIIADAEYSQDTEQRATPTFPWTDSVNKYESYGEQLLELFVGVGGPPAAVEWGAYNPAHEYTITRTGTGTPAEFQFQIYDIYAQNNTGGLCVSLQMLNRPPVADANGPYTGDEGSMITLDATGSSDPDDDALEYSWTVDSPLCSFMNPTVATPTLTCTDNGFFTVTVTVDDGYGATDSDTASVTMANVAPTVSIDSYPMDPVEVGTPNVVAFSFTDPGSNDTHTATCQWNGITQDLGTVTSPATCDAPTVPGIYMATVTVTDDDGGVGSAMTGLIIVYDGYVNGGGQILETLDPDAKKIEQYKISFGGWLYRLGSSAPLCEWQVNLHNVSVDALDKGKFHGTKCTKPGYFPNPGQSDGVTNFTVYGTWNGDPGYRMIFRMEDNTEPGDQDTIRFELYDGSGILYDSSDYFPSRPGADFASVPSVYGNARTYLDNGNLQIYLP
jgi:hypothetical protein